MQIITPLQHHLLEILSKRSERESFYLSGGTALSFCYLQHRLSRDLDFFTSEEELIRPFSLAFDKQLNESGYSVQRKRAFSSFVELVISSKQESTIVQFALDSPYRLQPVKESEEISGLLIDSLQDLAANKMLALFGRAALRDFVDIFCLASGHFSKIDLLEFAEKKDPGFNLYWFGVALGQIESFQESDPDFQLLLQPITFEQIHQFMMGWQDDISQDLGSRSS